MAPWLYSLEVIAEDWYIQRSKKNIDFLMNYLFKQFLKIY